MNKVRKDVRIKLMEGLVKAQQFAKAHGASIPNCWQYKTSSADHYIYVDYRIQTVYFNTKGSNGKRYHSEAIL